MNIRYLNKIIGLSFVALLATTVRAEAAVANGVGSLINNVTNTLNGGGFYSLLSGAAYLMGLLFALTGVFKFKEHVDGQGSRNEIPLGAAIKRFVAGGMLLSLPFMSSAMQGSLGVTGTVISAGAMHGGGGLTGMDAMIVAFMSDIAQPAVDLLRIVAFLGAIIFLIIGIIRLTKTEQEGARGPAGLGTIMTFLTSGALFSFGNMAGAFSNSIFGSSQTATFVNIGANVLPAADVAQVAPVIEAVMTFVYIVGLIAFLRGWFVLKSFADGNSQVSLAQAITFLIGGSLAINLGAVIDAVQNTVGLVGANSITFN